MGDNVSIDNSDLLLAKKRLANGLRNIVVAQTVVLFVPVLGVLLFCIAVVLKWETGASLGIFLACFWFVVSVILASLGCHRLSNATVPQPKSVRLYASSYFVLPFLLIFLLFLCPPFLCPPFVEVLIVFTVLIGYPFYGLIPQFFIARWLTKEAENDMIKSNVDNQEFRNADDQE